MLFQRILLWIKERLDKMISSFDIKSSLKMDIILSAEMSSALEDWCRMYIDQAPWLGGANGIESMSLPSTIASEIARLVTNEMKVSISGSPRADYLAIQMKPLLNNIKEFVEYGVAKGGIMFKPYVSSDGNIAIDAVQADQFFPVLFDSNRKITGAIFVDQRRVGGYFYTRLESHIMEANKTCRIRNAVFRSSDKDTLGYSASFQDIPDWANLIEEAVIQNVTQPLFAYFRFPLANNIDTTSPLGVSCYARAKNSIKQCDILWTDLGWEYESARRALYADETAFDKDPKTLKPILPFKRLYRTLKATSTIGEKGKLFDEWSPAIRVTEMLEGLNAALRVVELNTGLAFGTLSEPDEKAVTATEVKMSKQRSFSTVSDTQKSLRAALDDLLYAMNVWASIGALAPRGKYETTYDFDDSIINDKGTQFVQDTQALSMQAMSLIEFRMRTYGESKEKAIEMLAMRTLKPAQDGMDNLADIGA